MSTKNIDKAIDEYIKDGGADSSFVTGWVLVASLSSPSHSDSQSDGYITVASEGLPHHIQVGLLSVAMEDKKNVGFVGSLQSYFEAAFGDDDEDDE